MGGVHWLGNPESLPSHLPQACVCCCAGGGGRETTVDYGTYCRYPWRVKIGASTTINRDCRFFPLFFHKDVTIQIGSHVAVAAGVSFIAAGHDYTSRYLPDTAASISVGDWVWIGANATILPGVSIGEGAVIGAGSVVTRDVPAWTIAVGVPAKVTKQRVLEEDTP